MPQTPEKNDCEQVTRLLMAWSKGENDAFEELLPFVFQELRRRAASLLRGERQGHTLQPTALVNEAYLRLIDQNRVTWRNRVHFYAVSARLMRRILVDHARARQAGKRRGQAIEVTFDEALNVVAERDVDLVALDEALTGLAQLDERQAKVVELRYFGGMTIAETAEFLGVGHATIERDWHSAKAWLAYQMRQA